MVEAVYLIQWTSDASPKLIEYVSARLEQTGLIVFAAQPCPDKEHTLMTVGALQQQLEGAAEHMKLVKEHNKTGDLELFNTANRELFEGINGTNFFTPSETTRIVRHMIDFIQVGEKEIKKFRKLGVDGCNLHEKMFHALGRAGKVDVLSPLHSTSATAEKWRNKMFWDTMAVFPPNRSRTPINQFEQYFGSQITFYFAWMDFFTRALTVPAMAGLALHCCEYWNGRSVNTSIMAPFFSLGIFIWGVCFLLSVRRHCATLAWRWGTHGLDRREDLRPEFRGMERRSPVTGHQEIWYPRHRRTAKYFVSGAITAAMLAVAFAVMICMLNLEGYIQPLHNRRRWPTDGDHPFHIKFLADLAQPGHLLDTTSDWMSLVPVLLHVVVIMQLNSAYRYVAQWLNRWENHRDVHSYENSLIVKRFLFEAFDAYIALFYLAFYEFDVMKLRDELVALYTTDSLRRVVTESLLPLAMSLWTAHKWRHTGTALEATVSSTEQQDSGEKELQRGQCAAVEDVRKRREGEIVTARPVWMQATLDEYEQFDDYLEMILEFGYITLFAAAFPLAPLVSIACNFVEIRSDAFKLLYVTRKPRALPAANIGMWLHVLQAMVMLSALTNCLMFGFTSQQMMQWLPDFFYIASNGDHAVVAGSGRYVVLLIFAAERLLWGVGFLVTIVIDPVPEDVRVKVARREYHHSLDLRQNRKKQIELVLINKAKTA